MAKKINIDGYIGPWGYSKQYFRAMADPKEDIDLFVSSLGGDLDHAIDIANQIAEHGRVTVHFSGFNASSATVIALSAKKSLIAANSFYLIHKALVWVDKFGYLNEDDLETAIAEFEKQKDNAAKVTLVLADMYAKKTGKPVADILNLMKEEKWLTAREALEEGFVDDIYEAGQVEDPLENEAAMTMIAASGYPTPQRKGIFESSTPLKINGTLGAMEPEEPSPGFLQRVIEHVRNFFSTQNNTTNMQKTDLSRLCKAANVQDLNIEDNKIELDEAAALAIENRLAELETQKPAESQVTPDNSELEALRKENQELKNQIAEFDTTPGADTATVTTDTDGDGSTANNLEEGFFSRMQRLRNEFN